MRIRRGHPLWQRLVQGAAGRKYLNCPTEDGCGFRHPSKLQARVTDALRARAKAVITEVSVPLSPRANDRIRIDALVIESVREDGSFIGRFVEVKGCDLAAGVQKRRRFEDRYGVPIRVVYRLRDVDSVYL